MTNLKSPINQTCLFLDWEMKPEYPERTHICLGGISKLCTERQQTTRLFTSGKHLGQLSIFPEVDVPASSPQGEKAKSYISDSTGLS